MNDATAIALDGLSDIAGAAQSAQDALYTDDTPLDGLTAAERAFMDIREQTARIREVVEDAATPARAQVEVSPDGVIQALRQMIRTLAVEATALRCERFEPDEILRRGIKMEAQIAALTVLLSTLEPAEKGARHG